MSVAIERKEEVDVRMRRSSLAELFEEVHFGNHFALEGVARPKSEICRSIGARVLIDDNPRYAVECAEAGIHVLLFDWNNAYPWSKTSDGEPLIVRLGSLRPPFGSVLGNQLFLYQGSRGVGFPSFRKRCFFVSLERMTREWSALDMMC